jgi:hypothetical protein
VAYASQIKRDNPEGAAAMFRVRDRVVKRLVDSKALPHMVYGVNETVPWAVRVCCYCLSLSLSLFLLSV